MLLSPSFLIKVRLTTTTSSLSLSFTPDPEWASITKLLLLMLTSKISWMVLTSLHTLNMTALLLFLHALKVSKGSSSLTSRVFPRDKRIIFSLTSREALLPRAEYFLEARTGLLVTNLETTEGFRKPMDVKFSKAT